MSLSATSYTLPVGASASLSASTTFDIGPTPYTTQIWDTTTSPGTFLRRCTAFTVCPWDSQPLLQVSQNFAGTRSYTATLAASDDVTYPPANLESSLTDYVTWSDLGWGVSLDSSSSSPVVTATANNNVGPSPYFIYLYSEGSHQVVATCSAGTTITQREWSLSRQEAVSRWTRESRMTS